MFQVSSLRSHRFLILGAVTALVLSACGGGSATASPSASNDSTGTGPTPSVSEQPTDTGSSPDGASSALANLTSLRVSMTVIGGPLSDDTLSNLPDAPESGIFKVNGTYILKPAMAADITVAGLLHAISVGGNDYQDVGLMGSFTEGESTGQSLADELSPVAIYSAFDFSGYNFVASESKDGVDADHYRAGDSGLAELASVSGVDSATWTADVWIAHAGGYPVALSIVATASDKSIAFERTFDLTDVDSASNRVTAPTNISGA